jgi:hypothetical protein
MMCPAGRWICGLSYDKLIRRGFKYNGRGMSIHVFDKR